jgi:ferredoxin-NADP reductase
MSLDRFIVTVHAMRNEAHGILSLDLRDAGGGQLPPFTSGSHTDLHLPNGMVRSYSIFNAPDERHRYLVGVLNDRNSRGGSRFIHEQLREGSTLEITRPRNNFELDESALRSVLLAGGIGITPIYSMFNRLLELGSEVELIYCARSRNEAAFVDVLTPGPATQLLFDNERGGPPDLRDLLAGRDAETHFYCCGPTPMLEAFEAVCRDLSYRNIHIERFAASTKQATFQQMGYQVTLARTGKTVHVPSGGVLLDVLNSAGAQIPYSCREGTCGTCETGVLSGTPDHRDSVLSEAERASNKTMMVCVSGCRDGALILDA